MSTATVRISEAGRKLLRELAEKEGVSMQAVLEKALEIYRRQLFLEKINQAYSTLRQDKTAWAKVMEERTEFETTISDGLESLENWDQEDGSSLPDQKEVQH